MLADVFFPTMDTSCQTEIVGLGIKIGKGSAAIDIDTANFKHLTQYVRERQFRERTLVPIGSNKMDVGAVGVSSGQSQQPYGNGQQNLGGQAYGWAFKKTPNRWSSELRMSTATTTETAGKPFAGGTASVLELRDDGTCTNRRRDGKRARTRE